MPDNVLKFIFSGDVKGLESAINRGSRTIQTFGQKSITTFNKVGRTIGHISDRYLTRFNALLGGAALTLAARNVINFDARLARLAIQAGLTKKEMFALKEQLFEVGRETHQGPEDLLAGIEQIVEKTGNFKFAIESLRDMGIVASATAADMEGVGGTVSNLQEKMRITGQEVLKAFDILNKQGKEGAFTLKEMSANGEELFTTAAAVNLEGLRGIRIWGAFAQMARRGSGSSAEATTAMNMVAADLIQNHKIIRKLTGFSIFDEARSRKEGRSVLKSFDVIMKEIIKRTNGDIVKLQEIFNIRAIRAVRPLVQSYLKFGDFSEFEKFIEMGGDGAETMKDFAFWSDQTAAHLRDLRTEGSEFANERLDTPIKGLTKAFDFLNRHPAVTKGGLWALLGIGGTLAAAKIANAVRDLYGIFRGGGKGPLGKGPLGGLGGLGGPTPVYVVNFPGMGTSMPYPGGWGPAGSKAPSGKLPGGNAGGASLGLLQSLGTAAGWLGGLLMLDRQFQEHGINTRPDENKLRGALGLPPIKNDITINMRVDERGRVTSETNSMNTNVKLNRGNLK